MLPLAVFSMFAMTLLLGLTLLFLLYRTVRGLIRFVLPLVSTASEQIIFQAIACAVSLFLFPQVGRYTLGVLAALLESVFVKLPGVYVARVEPVLQGCEQIFDNHCLRELGNATTTTWIDFTRQLLVALNLASVPLVEVVLFLTTWAVLAFLLDRTAVAMSGTADAQNSFLGRTVVAIGSTTRAARQNFYFPIVLVVSTYLAVESLSAIPDLIKPATEKLTPLSCSNSLKG
jgi:hypothetical protein